MAKKKFFKTWWILRSFSHEKGVFEGNWEDEESWKKALSFFSFVKAHIYVWHFRWVMPISMEKFLSSQIAAASNIDK